MAPLFAFFIFELYNFITVIVSMRAKKTNKEQEEEIRRRAIEEYIREQALLQAQQKPAEQKPAEQKPESDSPERMKPQG